MDGHSKRGGVVSLGLKPHLETQISLTCSAVLLRTQTRTSTAVERVTIVTSYAFLHRMQIRCSSHWHTYMVTQVPVYFKIENKKNVFFLYTVCINILGGLVFCSFAPSQTYMEQVPLLYWHHVHASVDNLGLLSVVTKYCIKMYRFGSPRPWCLLTSFMKTSHTS